MGHGRDRKREGRALGLSVLLHAFVAPLFIAVFVGVDDLRPEAPIATSGLFSITVAQRAAPAPVRPAPSHDATIRLAAPVPSPSRSLHPAIVAATQRHRSGTSHKTRRIAFVAPVPTPLPSPTHAAATASPAARTAAVRSDTATAPPATPGPVPATPQPTAVAAAEGPALAEAPVGGWGQNFRDPTVLDDDALAQLRARFHGTVVHVDVDEEGRATRVSVESSGLDSDARAEIERRLMTVRYVPAECNGLRCAASLELRV